MRKFYFLTSFLGQKVFYQFLNKEASQRECCRIQISQLQTSQEQLACVIVSAQPNSLTVFLNSSILIPRFSAGGRLKASDAMTRWNVLK